MPVPHVSSASPLGRPAEPKDATDPMFQEAISILLDAGLTLEDMLVDPAFPVAELNRFGKHQQARLQYDMEIDNFYVLRGNFARLREQVANDPSRRIRKAGIAHVAETLDGQCDCRLLSGAHRCAVCSDPDIGISTIPMVLVQVDSQQANQIGWSANAQHGQPNDDEERDQRIISAAIAGQTPAEISRWVGASPATVVSVIEQNAISQLIEQTASLSQVAGIRTVPWRTSAPRLVALLEETVYGPWTPVCIGLLRHAANAGYTSEEISNLAAKLRTFTSPGNALDFLDKRISKDEARITRTANSRAAGATSRPRSSTVDRMRAQFEKTEGFLDKMQTKEDILRYFATPEERVAAQEYLMEIRIKSATPVELMQQQIAIDEAREEARNARGAA